MFRLDGKVALLMAAGQGMGLGVARALAAQGARVAVNDCVTERAVTATLGLKQQGSNACAAPGDITRAAVRQQIINATQTPLGPVDILGHNAGVPTGMQARSHGASV